MSMPVFLNEPCSILQKTAELCMNPDLMARVVAEKDSTKRLGYIGAFYTAQYSQLLYRNSKPFNPILGFVKI